MGEPKLQEDMDRQIAYRVNHLMFINGRTAARRVAHAIGISHTSFNNKLGGSRWTAEDLVRLSDLFEVPIEYLIGRAPIESARPINDEIPAIAGIGMSRTSDYKFATSGEVILVDFTTRLLHA